MKKIVCMVLCVWILDARFPLVARKSRQIVEKIPATFTLAFSGLVLSVLIGFPLGIIAALNRGRWPDNLIPYPRL